MRRALEAPIRQITKNAGVDGSVVVGKLLEQNKKTHGYDAQNEEYCDMFAKGIIDPVKVDKDNSTIVNGSGKKSDIEARCSSIKQKIDETTSDYDKEKLQERLAKLAGGVAVIKVGGATEVEVKELSLIHI